jgi:chromosome segregation ATPase
VYLPDQLLSKRKPKLNKPRKEHKPKLRSHKGMLTTLQAARELKIARKATLEAELKNLSAEIEADDKKIAELPGLIEKTQEEASSAMTEVNHCEAELTVLSNAQQDYQERMENIRQTISNASNVVAKYLNI